MSSGRNSFPATFVHAHRKSAPGSPRSSDVDPSPDDATARLKTATSGSRRQVNQLRSDAQVKQNGGTALRRHSRRSDSRVPHEGFRQRIGDVFTARGAGKSPTGHIGA